MENSKNECIADRPAIYGQLCFKLQTTMSTQVYCNVRVTALDSCPKLWATGKWFLLHDNVWPQTPLSVTEFSQYIKSLYCHMCHILQICDHAILSYSHDRTNTERPPLQWWTVIQTAVTKPLCSIPASASQVCFKDLEKCWKQCIDAGGSYFKEYP